MTPPSTAQQMVSDLLRRVCPHITSHVSIPRSQCDKCLEDALLAATARGRREVLAALFHDLFNGQTDAEWLAHAHRFKGGSAESWTIGELIERAIRQRQAGG